MKESGEVNRIESIWASRSGAILIISLLAGFIEAALRNGPLFGPPIAIILGLIAAPMFALVGVFRDEDRKPAIHMLVLIGIGIMAAISSLGATGSSVNNLIQRVPAATPSGR